MDANPKEAETSPKTCKIQCSVTFSLLGVVGKRLLSGENTTMACSASNAVAKLMQAGCHENVSDPGEDTYTMRATKATDSTCTTMTLLQVLLRQRKRSGFHVTVLVD
jgi:hypothetical protein